MQPANIETSTSPNNKEIDLKELCIIFWNEKALIVLSTITFALLAGAFAFLSPPTYQTQATLLPPTVSDLSVYNSTILTIYDGTEANPKDITLSPTEAYEIFLKNFSSQRVRQTFFEQFYFPALQEREPEITQSIAQDKFSDSLTLTLPKKAGEITSIVKFEDQSPELAMSWANEFVHLSLSAAERELLNNIKKQVSTKLLALNTEIETLRIAAKEDTPNQIKRLQEAHTIASAAGLETPPEGSPFIAIANSSRDSTKATFVENDLLYLRGTKALQAELEQLKQREDVDPFIANLPSLVQDKLTLERLHLKKLAVTPASIDRLAETPENPIKPKKLLIILLGLILGSIVGVITVVTRFIFRQ
tara:strand:- start:9305 stop:10390 length:1086 start_codon:yes stop_codon:yes gene_type:complete